MICFKIVLMLFLSFSYPKARADHKRLVTKPSSFHSISSCLSALESSVVEQATPGTLSSTTNFLNPVKDLIITFDGHVYWKGQEVVFRYRDDYAINYNLTHTDSYRRSLLNVLLALTESPNQFINAEDIYWDAFTHSNPESGELSLGSVKFLISNIRRGFSKVDPDFKHIVTKPIMMYAWDTYERINIQSLGDLSIHFEMQDVWWKGIKIPHLTLMEFNIIKTLFKKPNHPIRQTSLYQEGIGSKTFNKDLDPNRIIKTMQVMISTIRSKFKAIDPDFSALKSFRAQSEEGPSLMLEIKRH